VLVLAKSQHSCKSFAAKHDFLTATSVGQEQIDVASLYDYVPLVFFVAALVGVAAGVIPMVQASVLLVVVFMIGGWVEAGSLRECIDWNLLILMGCALGFAGAAEMSGLSSKGALLVRSANLGKQGTVFALFLFTLLITETVTDSAAAAVGFPLAKDLSEELEFHSMKPLVMTVILAASTAYASPISSAANLMVVGPGGYSFRDFLKVGLMMDSIYWIGCCSLLPFVFPLV